MHHSYIGSVLVVIILGVLAFFGITILRSGSGGDYDEWDDEDDYDDEDDTPAVSLHLLVPVHQQDLALVHLQDRVQVQVRDQVRVQHPLQKR